MVQTSAVARMPLQPWLAYDFNFQVTYSCERLKGKITTKRVRRRFTLLGKQVGTSHGPALGQRGGLWRTRTQQWEDDEDISVTN